MRIHGRLLILCFTLLLGIRQSGQAQNNNAPAQEQANNPPAQNTAEVPSDPEEVNANPSATLVTPSADPAGSDSGTANQQNPPPPRPRNSSANPPSSPSSKNPASATSEPTPNPADEAENDPDSQHLKADLVALSERIEAIEARLNDFERAGSGTTDDRAINFWILAAVTAINFAFVVLSLLKGYLPKPQPKTPGLSGRKDSGSAPPASLRQEAAPLASQPEIQELKTRVAQVEKDIPAQVSAQIAPVLTRLAEAERFVQQEPRPTVPDSEVIQKAVAHLQREVVSLQHELRSESRLPVSPLETELVVLGDVWRKLREGRDSFQAFEAPRQITWEGLRNPLLVDLPKLTPEDIKPTFDMILAPARDFDTMITKISLVPRLLKKELPPLGDSQELTRLRELSNLLILIMSSNVVADRLNFRLESWIADQFVSFADLYLQRYQQAHMDGQQGQQNPLEPGLKIIRQVLRIVDLEPVELTPGQTPFDSARHIGRSTASNPSFANGVIVGVIRNGFVRGGREVIRQPEVIVNRVA